MGRPEKKSENMTCTKQIRNSTNKKIKQQSKAFDPDYGNQLKFYNILNLMDYLITKIKTKRMLLKMNRRFFCVLINRHRMVPMSPQKESDRATAVWFASVFIQPHIPAPTGTRAVEGAEEVPWLGGKPVDQREKSFAFCTKVRHKETPPNKTSAIWTW